MEKLPEKKVITKWIALPQGLLQFRLLTGQSFICQKKKDEHLNWPADSKRSDSGVGCTTLDQDLKRLSGVGELHLSLNLSDQFDEKERSLWKHSTSLAETNLINKVEKVDEKKDIRHGEGIASKSKNTYVSGQD